MLVRWGPALRTRRTRLSSAASTVLGPGPGRAARGRAVTHRPHHPTHIPRYRRDCGAGAGTTELTLSADLWQHWVYVVVAGPVLGPGPGTSNGFHHARPRCGPEAGLLPAAARRWRENGSKCSCTTLGTVGLLLLLLLLFTEPRTLSFMMTSNWALLTVAPVQLAVLTVCSRQSDENTGYNMLLQLNNIYQTNPAFKKKNLSRHFMFQHCQLMRNNHTEQLQGGNGKINSESVRAVIFNPTCVSIYNLSMGYICRGGACRW